MSTTTTPSSSFTEIPTLSLRAASSPASKPAFLASLRTALLTTGFLYLTDLPLSPTLLATVQQQCHAFFSPATLPPLQKDAIEMKNKASFLGYSRLGNETTAGRPDNREQLDLATPDLPAPPPGAAACENLKGPNQWPDESCLPGFRACYEEYMRAMGKVSREFTGLIAEAIGLERGAFEGFFDGDDQTHKLKLVMYPEMEGEACGDEKWGAGEVKGGRRRAQGVGPHKDSMLTSYLLQASGHMGLQAQNTRGEWIDCPPKEGTVVVAIGQGLEAITGGVCASTTHRVLSPLPGEGPRFSIPFFQGVSFDATFESMDVPASVRALRPEIRKEFDDVEFTFMKGRWSNLGEAILMNRVKSHTDVGEKWYPELLAKIREEQAKDVKAKQEPQQQPKSSNVQVDATRQAVEAH